MQVDTAVRGGGVVKWLWSKYRHGCSLVFNVLSVVRNVICRVVVTAFYNNQRHCLCQGPGPYKGANNVGPTLYNRLCVQFVCKPQIPLFSNRYRVDVVVMGSWCNGQRVVWAFIVILLLSSLWFIWNNSFCQIPARYTRTASNIRNLPINPWITLFLYVLRMFYRDV